MSRTTKLICLISVVFAAVAAVMIAISFFLGVGDEKIIHHTYDIQDFNEIEINVNECEVNVYSSDKTYVKISKNARASIKCECAQGKLFITDEMELGDFLDFTNNGAEYSGIGEGLISSADDEKTVISIYIDDSKKDKILSVNAQKTSISINADLDTAIFKLNESNLVVNDVEFRRFDAETAGCNIDIKLPFTFEELSRDISTFDTELNINGIKTANSDFYKSEGDFRSLKIISDGGSVALLFE